MTIQWSNVKSISPDLIAEFERLAGVELPDDYKAVAASHDGAYMGGGKIIVFPDEDRDPPIRRAFLSLVPFVRYGHEMSMCEHFENKDKYIRGLITFGVDGGANEFAFDFREDKSAPSVVFLYMDQDNPAIFRIADGFSSLLALAQDDPDYKPWEGEEFDKLFANSTDF